MCVRVNRRKGRINIQTIGTFTNIQTFEYNLRDNIIWECHSLKLNQIVNYNVEWNVHNEIRHFLIRYTKKYIR